MIQIETFDAATPFLRALLARGTDLAPLMARIGEALVSLVQLGFRSSSSPYGVRWAALKLRQGQPLRDTGALMNSITYQPETRAVVIGPGFGPSSKGAAVQQFGATIVPKKPGGFLAFKPRGSSRWIFARKVTVPARPFLPTRAGGLPDSWARTIMQETGRYLMGNA